MPGLRRLGRRQVRGRRLVARASPARRSSTARSPSSSAGWATSSTAAITSSSPATWSPWRSARAARCSSTGAASAFATTSCYRSPVPELIPSTVIDDVVLVRPDVHGDERGRFVETYRRSWFPDRPRDDSGQPLGEAGRRRGGPALPPAPGRLLVRPARPGPCRPARPARRARRTDGATEVIDLDGDVDQGVYIPPGVAHGFAALTDVLLYVPRRQLLRRLRRARPGLGRPRGRSRLGRHRPDPLEAGPEQPPAGRHSRRHPAPPGFLSPPAAAASRPSARRRSRGGRCRGRRVLRPAHPVE